MVIRRRHGFTLIELLVVMAIVGTLLSIVAPRYFRHLDHTRDTALRQTLVVMRDAIDKFHADRARYPKNVEELVEQRYLRQLPADPVAGDGADWVTVPPPDDAAGGVWDVRSAAAGAGSDGIAYAMY